MKSAIVIMESAMRWIEDYFLAFVYSLLLASVFFATDDVLEFLSRQRGTEIKLWMLLFSLFWAFVVSAYSLMSWNLIGFIGSLFPGAAVMHYFGEGEGLYTFKVVLLLLFNIFGVRLLPDFYRGMLYAVNSRGVCSRDKDLYLVGSFSMFLVILASVNYLSICM